MNIKQHERNLPPGKLLAALRIRKGMTQSELGKAVGKFASEIANIERGVDAMGVKRARLFSNYFRLASFEPLLRKAD